MTLRTTERGWETVECRREWEANQRRAIKNLFLMMARHGDPRPKQHYGWRLGMYLSQFTCQSSPRYDAEFTHAIIQERPDWFAHRKSE